MRFSIHSARSSLAIASLITALCAPYATAQICGDFELTASPTAAGETSLLTAAHAIASDDVWAVGTAVGGRYSTALHWNGSTWTQTPTPNPSATQNDLRGVAAFAPGDIWAVGGRNPAAGSVLPLVLHWDGEEWSIDSGPSGLEAGAFLWSVRVVGQDLWAVGDKVEGAPGPLGASLAARRRGGSWEVFPSPNIENRSNRFAAVDGAFEDDVWAVGYARSIGATYRIFLAHWDGTSWNDVAVPTPGANDFLRGVTAISSNDVWAVGEWFHMTEGVQPLILHWDGLSWSQSPLALLPDGAASFEDVVAISSSDVWAVGTHATSAGVPRPLLMHWDGSDWTQVPGAPGLEYEWFRGVTQVGSCEVWAVGQFFDGAQTANLIERLPGQSQSTSVDASQPGGVGLLISPNPVLERAVVHLALPRTAEVGVSVYSADGRLIRPLSIGSRDAGAVSVAWDRRDAGGRRVAPGVYFLRVVAGADERTAKMVVR